MGVNNFELRSTRLEAATSFQYTFVIMHYVYARDRSLLGSRLYSSKFYKIEDSIKFWKDTENQE